jgi:hypothetical protein|tara:strand:- start:204 stop:440 length:237 start_codon:yes stop_codon:yes gene_type:complete
MTTQKDSLTIGDKTYDVTKFPPAALVHWPRVQEQQEKLNRLQLEYDATSRAKLSYIQEIQPMLTDDMLIEPDSDESSD